MPGKEAIKSLIKESDKLRKKIAADLTKLATNYNFLVKIARNNSLDELLLFARGNFRSSAAMMRGVSRLRDLEFSEGESPPEEEVEREEESEEVIVED